MNRFLALAAAGCTGGMATEAPSGSDSEATLGSAETGDEVEDTADTGVPCPGPTLPSATPRVAEHDIAYPYPGGCVQQAPPELGFLPLGPVVSMVQTDCDIPGTGRGGLTQLRTVEGATVLLETLDPAYWAVLGLALPRVPAVDGADGVFAVYSDFTYSYKTGAWVYDASSLDLLWTLEDEREQWIGYRVLGDAYLARGETDYDRRLGTLYAYEGHLSGTLSLDDATAVHQGLYEGDDLGWELWPLDDLDGDGLPELGLGMNGAGWLLNGDDVLVDQGIVNATFIASNHGYAWHVTTSLGDLDGDGYGDFSFNTHPGRDLGTSVQVYSHAQGLLSEVFPPAEESWLAAKLTAAGDVDADGEPDFVYWVSADDYEDSDRVWFGRVPTCGTFTTDEVALTLPLPERPEAIDVWDALGGYLTLAPDPDDPVATVLALSLP